jgi:hypothetical protein
MRSTGLVLVWLTTVVAGCANEFVQSRVRHQAAFDHDCPLDQIQIVQEDTSIWSYRVKVCGTERKYRDFGNHKEWRFVDVTIGSPAPPRP